MKITNPEGIKIQFLFKFNNMILPPFLSQWICIVGKENGIFRPDAPFYWRSPICLVYPNIFSTYRVKWWVSAFRFANADAGVLK